MINLKLVLACGLAASLGLSACNKGEKSSEKKILENTSVAAKPSPPKIAETSSKDSAVHRSEIITKMQADLDTLGERIEALQKKIAKAADKTGSKAKKEMNEDLAVLKAERKKLSSKLEDLKGSASDKWEDLREKAGNGLDSLKSGVDRLWKKVK